MYRSAMPLGGVLSNPITLIKGSRFCRELSRKIGFVAQEVSDVGLSVNRAAQDGKAPDDLGSMHTIQTVDGGNVGVTRPSKVANWGLQNIVEARRILDSTATSVKTDALRFAVQVGNNSGADREEILKSLLERFEQQISAGILNATELETLVRGATDLADVSSSLHRIASRLRLEAADCEDVLSKQQFIGITLGAIGVLTFVSTVFLPTLFG